MPDAVKRVGLVVRVSTDRQAANDEGSLKNQLQRLRHHVEYKNVACGEEWVEASVYELRAVSGKTSVRSPEFERLFADIGAGRINTILCTALDRISRSVKDFLWFFEVLNEHGVEFVCLKQNYDTTTPQGKLFVTIMMALAEFEREQTSERTKDATAARAERGLWNGGRLLGYDGDPDRKSTLTPNPEEAAVVNFVFDAYLACGSLKETAEALNRRGYRTKSYTSRRGKFHSGTEFQKTTVQYLLRNPSYIAKKEINKRSQGGTNAKGNGYRVVDAAWPPLVDVEKFEAVQRLIAENGRTNHNGSAPVRHTYVLSRGLLHCGRCGSLMQGRCGTGRLGTKYFYYVCRIRDCSLRVSASEVENAVLGRIAELAQENGLLTTLVEETNKRLHRQRPSLERRHADLQKKLADVNATADKLLTEWAAMEQNAGRAFLTAKLNQLARRREDLERGIAEIDNTLADLTQHALSADGVRAALRDIGLVYDCLKPYEQRELMALVLHRAEVNERQIVLEINAGLGAPAEIVRRDEGAGVRLGPDWLPE